MQRSERFTRAGFGAGQPSAGIDESSLGLHKGSDSPWQQLTLGSSSASPMQRGRMGLWGATP